MALIPTLSAYWSARRDREFHKDFFYDADLGWQARDKTPAVAVRHITQAASRRTGHRQRQEGSRSSAASGDGNGNSDDPDPERRQPLQLYDQASLAGLLCTSKKSVQNIYSATPWLLPPAIQIPGARGPRWPAAAVQAWLEQRPAHTSKPAVVTPKRKVGRPRIIALAGKKGGAA